MCYAALNQGGDFIASFDGFIPLGGPPFNKLPDPCRSNGGRPVDTWLELTLAPHAPGPPPHVHTFAEHFVVAKCTLSLRVGNEVKVFHAGEGFRVPSGVVHQMTITHSFAACQHQGMT